MLNPSISLNGSAAAVSPKPANGLTASRRSTIGVDFAAQQSDLSVNAPAAQTGGPLRPRQQRSANQARRVASPRCALRSIAHTLKRQTHKPSLPQSTVQLKDRRILASNQPRNINTNNNRREGGATSSHRAGASASHRSHSWSCATDASSRR
jgi:hypothetical protein